MRKKSVSFLLILVLLLSISIPALAVEQKNIIAVRDYPSLPQPYKMLDWKTIARKFIDLVTDEGAGGAHFPVFSWNQPGFMGVAHSFSLPSYVGQKIEQGGGEAINLFSVMLTATLMGIDMRNYKGESFLNTTQVYFNPSIGTFFNNPGSQGGQTYWYDLFPTMLHTMLSSLYHEVRFMAEQARQSADTWYKVCEDLGGKDLNFDGTSFNFTTRKPFVGRWKEPDAAAGIALIAYYNYIQHGDPKHLEAAVWCMDWLESLDYNPLYEVLGYYAPLIAARMNAEQGTNYSVGRFLSWMPGNDSKPRQGWGVINQSWNGFDCYGLAGSEASEGGYAFAMNTFVLASAIAPVVRYDGRFADDIGKWLLHAANASRFFFPNQLPPGHETCPDLAGDQEGVIPYEGLRKQHNDLSPFAMGDPLLYGWADTDRGIYSGAPLGMMAAMLETTEVEGILRFDLLKTDYARLDAYPSYLYYNPYETEQTVHLNVGEGPHDLYDSAAGRMLVSEANGKTAIRLAANRATTVVVVPSKAIWVQRGALQYADGVFVGAARPVIQLIEPRDGDKISQAVDVAVRTDVPPAGIEKLRVTLGGQLVYEGAHAGQIQVDITGVPSGSMPLRVHLHTRDGLVETDQMRVQVQHSPGGIASYTPGQMAALWSSIPGMPGKVDLVDTKAVITETSPETWGGVMSPWFSIDLDQSATLVLELAVSHPAAAVQLHLEGTPHGYYLLGDSALDGTVSINLQEALERHHPDLVFQGVHTAQIYLLATGAQGARVEVSRVSLNYD